MVIGMDAPIGKEPQLTNDAYNDNPNRCIRCPDCGEEIQMVPTLTDMIAAIEEHISIHREHSKTDSSNSYIKAPCIRENLTEQVILRAAELREMPKDSTWINLE